MVNDECIEGEKSINLFNKFIIYNSSFIKRNEAE